MERLTSGTYHSIVQRVGIVKFQTSQMEEDVRKPPGCTYQTLAEFECKGACLIGQLRKLVAFYIEVEIKEGKEGFFQCGRVSLHLLTHPLLWTFV